MYIIELSAVGFMGNLYFILYTLLVYQFYIFNIHYHRRLECKSRKSRDTWSNRQVWPWSTKWSRAKANRVLPREHTGHSKHPLPTTQETSLHMDITRWSILKSDWLYSLQLKMENLYTVSKNKTRSWVWLIMNSLLPNSDLNWRK